MSFQLSPGAGYTSSYIALAATANTAAITITGYSLTGSNATSMITGTGTWNTTGTPTALFINITDTASNAASLLADLQVGGSSKFKVTKGGAATFAGIISVPGGANPVLTTTAGITSGAGAQTGTLTNAPAAGDPSSWIPIDDNGTTRYIPAWGS